VIDVHCHILPGVDDGSNSWDMTLEMCRLASQDGITHIVATPHANSQFVFDRRRLSERLEELRRRAPDIDFSLGCDFRVSYDNLRLAAEHPKDYTIGSGPHLLVEFSDYETPRQMMESLFRLHSVGFITIITHPERNPIIAQYPELPKQFVMMGSLIQITADALTGGWGRSAKAACERLLRDDLVSIIATDAHESARRRPILSKARKVAARLVGEEIAEQLVEHNPRMIVGTNCPQ
jgi:protein-tyrosine phosphatase